MKLRSKASSMAAMTVSIFFATFIGCKFSFGEGSAVPSAKEERIDSASQGQAREGGTKPEEVNNTICPVSGDKVIKGKEFKIEYKGKVYNLCCGMCEKDFRKDPEAYIKKLEALKEEQTEEDIEESGHGHFEHHE